MFIKQVKEFGLGNFIMLTPAIAYLAAKHSQAIDVLFESEYVKQCYLEAPQINIVSVSNSEPIVTSASVNSRIPDYEFNFQNLIKKNWTPSYHTFIDTPDFSDKPRIFHQKYIVLINGCAPGFWQGKKEIDEKTFHFIRKQTSLPLVFIGSSSDLIQNCPWIHRVTDHVYLNNIRQCLSIIHGAHRVISNDTGLAHAAGAMNKDTLILWKDTPFIKNQNPGRNTFYASKNDWKSHIAAFLNAPLSASIQLPRIRSRARMYSNYLRVNLR